MSMRRIFILIFVCTFAMGASAQWTNLFKSITDKISSSSSSQTTTESSAVETVKNVLGNLIGNSMPVSEATLTGVWNYEGVSCVLKSEQALASIGGNVVTSNIESKLDGYLAKVGVVPGACTFTFSANDSCSFAIGGRSINGTYKLNKEDKTVAFSFYGRLNMTAHVSYEISNMNLVFNADKMLELIKRVSSAISSSADTGAGALGGESGVATLSTLKTISSLLQNYDGMMLGMRLKK